MGMQMFSVGSVVCSPSPDGVLFDMTDAGGVLLIKMGAPTAEEKKEFKRGIKMRFVVVDDIIMILVKMGNGRWMDAPYYKGLSWQLTSIAFPEDGQGLLVHAMLIDANTGVLVAQKAISLDTATSRALMTAIQEQPNIPDYNKRLDRVLRSYDTDSLVRIWREVNL